MTTFQNHIKRYQQVRERTETIVKPLMIEDYGIQTMPEVSPPKWHLAHVTWFFETFILLPFLPNYQVVNPLFDYLFNSYYETHSKPYPRPQRGLLSRPTVAEVYRYRHHVDRAIVQLLDRAAAHLTESDQQECEKRVILGLHHEQQHQELLLTDIQHIFAFNPLRPVYHDTKVIPTQPVTQSVPLHWINLTGGPHPIGHANTDFCFDNERPRHTVYLNNYALGNRLVTNGEYLEFIEANGYQKPEYWLADGWATVQQNQWRAPLYWEKQGHQWWQMTLAGMQPVDEQAPVCHVSFYEADAYARFMGKRLPTEAEWEQAAAAHTEQVEPTPVEMGNFYETGHLQPQPALLSTSSPLSNNFFQLFGDVWEWTQSPYRPYPGYQPLTGTLGEYNGKFMCSQFVLRGGSCVTPRDHIRATYRNFFYPQDRWQFSGIRLAVDRY